MMYGSSARWISAGSYKNSNNQAGTSPRTKDAPAGGFLAHIELDRQRRRCQATTRKCRFACWSPMRRCLAGRPTRATSSCRATTCTPLRRCFVAAWLSGLLGRNWVEEVLKLTIRIYATACGTNRFGRCQELAKVFVQQAVGYFVERRICAGGACTIAKHRADRSRVFEMFWPLSLTNKALTAIDFEV